MKSDAEWRKELSKEAYDVLRGKGTETPFTGKLLHNKDKGEYACGACGQVVFDSEHKFDSGSGWPSFYNVANNKAVTLKEDNSHGMQRVEVTCSSCGSHLGHVFKDAPQTPTGMRFCINSVALNFKPKD
jgi:peptide-methionine (R)-S-oxide reductase